MKRRTSIRPIIVALLALCPFVASYGGTCPENTAAGVIANVDGELLFVSENACDRGEALQEAVRAGVDLRRAALSGLNLRDIHLAGANLSGADFRNSILEDVDFSGANLSQANFDGAQFRHVSLRQANRQGSRLFI